MEISHFSDDHGLRYGFPSANNMKHKDAQCGFSLIELIVVIAIMATLLGLLAPAFLKYVSKKRNETCRHNRESMLRIYEKEVYDGNKSLEESEVVIVIPQSKDLIKNRFRNEMEQYYDCPNADRTSGNSNNNFKAHIDTTNKTAYIKCEACGDIVSIDFLGWGNEELALGSDPERDTKDPKKLDPEPEPTTLEESSEEPTSEETVDPHDWPYPDDSTWWDANNFQHADKVESYSLNNTGNDSYVTLKSPSGIFTARSGAQFVFVGDTGGNNSNNDYKIYLYEATSPEVYSAKHPQWLIQLTGNKRSYNITGMTNRNVTISNISQGDLIEFIDEDRGQVYTYVAFANKNEMVVSSSQLNNIRNNYGTSRPDGIHLHETRAVNSAPQSISEE